MAVTLLGEYDSGNVSRQKINDNFTALDGDVRAISAGGTGGSNFTDGGVLIGNGTGAIQATAVGSAGQVLTSNGPGTDPTFQTPGTGGTVTDVSIVTANGISGSVANPTTTPAITLTLDVNSYTEDSSPDTANDYILTYDTSAATNKKVKPSNLGLVIPTGMVTPYGGSSAPAAWLLCDGSEISRTTYSALFAIISTSYGAGNGSTTFNIPDMRGYVPYGYKSSDTNFDALNTPSVYVGEKTHTLTIAEIPAHTHPPLSPNTKFTGSQSGAGSGLYPSSTNVAHVNTTGSTGGGDAHNNMPPYRVMNYIIKT